MQNFVLLSEVGKSDKPVMVKRGLAATIDDLLKAAEYVIVEGNRNVMLCERGIRTFETQTRNTLDISAIPALKRLSHLPVIVDPSHASVHAWMVPALAKAAVAAGADGLLIETHYNPQEALVDGPQALPEPEFAQLMTDLAAFCAAAGRSL
jgi:3-deoxy-7-phosphoheptulonate synthase